MLEDAGPQSVSGWATGSAGPANESGQVLTYVIDSTTNAALFSAAPSVAANGTLTYTTAANASGVSTVTLHLTDSGGTTNGGVDTTGTQSFTITVTSVNDAPTFTAPADRTVNEDAAAQTVVGFTTPFEGAANESAQTMVFTVSNNSNPLFAVQPAISPAGTLTFTPAADANGVATVSVRVTDNGGTLNGGIDTSPIQTFDITIAAVNDAPSFTKGADDVVLEDARPADAVGMGDRAEHRRRCQ